LWYLARWHAETHPWKYTVTSCGEVRNVFASRTFKTQSSTSAATMVDMAFFHETLHQSLIASIVPKKRLAVKLKDAFIAPANTFTRNILTE
jgi:hypothetical protein